MTTTEPETHKAQKRHRCSWCGETIEPGNTYLRYRFFDCGDAGTVKMHPECYEAMQEEAKQEGGFMEWTPGEHERPSTPDDRPSVRSI